MENNHTKAKVPHTDVNQMPAPPDFPDDVDEMSSEDWTEANAWMANRRAWFAAQAKTEPKSDS